VTAVLAAAGGLVIGMFLGWLLTTTIVLAAISRSQQRMQRKVRWWQAKAASAQIEAERLAHLLEAHGLYPGPRPWEERQ
jgi:hypothetical protein